MRLGALLLALLLAAPAARAAAESEDADARPFGRGRLHAGGSFGWGHGYEVDQEQDEVRMLALLPHVGVGLSDPLGEGWLRGNFDLSFEPQLFANLDPDGGRAGGAALYLRYQLLASRRVVPFVGAGAGMLALDFDGRHQDDGFEFIAQAGAGAHWLVSERIALSFDARWHHISNADLRAPNHGIDSALLLAGVTWFPR